ncbi:MAG: tRNA (N6-threonylcarbamoyladenosine(37)-N6)-methyltransferase TrmO [Verrucomicrobiota bacterium JB023]|nr:tRNA (N6-threonylcarbamoyladenosine(37)-N6)-methyltransferase TrmO [Verrucomicrobiota bacterium JB023]
MEDFTIRAIAHARTPWKSKFGVPRQPGLIAQAIGEVCFQDEFAGEEARRGLEGFSHLWVSFVFDQVPEGETRLRVRPPRLGGNEMMGVFATRSPFRPNRLGLSVCEIAEVFPNLLLRGVDLVDGTPIVDIRPYIPYVESIPSAVGGFANEEPERIAMHVAREIRPLWDALTAEQQALIRGMIELDPRPAYQRQEGRQYQVEVGELRIGWKVVEGVALLTLLEDA